MVWRCRRMMKGMKTATAGTSTVAAIEFKLHYTVRHAPLVGWLAACLSRPGLNSSALLCPDYPRTRSCRVASRASSDASLGIRRRVSSCARQCCGNPRIERHAG